MDPEMMLHIRDGVVYLVALVLSICVHEFGHAWVADKLGDPLPRAQGRVTLNPLAHMDPIGTLVMPILGFVTALQSPSVASRMLGWGKPVFVSLSARSITRKITVKTAHLLIAAAGPAMNLLFGLVLSVVLVALLRLGHGPQALAFVVPLESIIGMNIGLAFFNLIPCPPLDGGAILRGVLPRNLEWISDRLEKVGFMVLFALLMTGALAYLMKPAHWASAYWIGHLFRWAVA